MLASPRRSPSVEIRQPPSVINPRGDYPGQWPGASSLAIKPPGHTPLTERKPPGRQDSHQPPSVVDPGAFTRGTHPGNRPSEESSWRASPPARVRPGATRIASASRAREFLEVPVGRRRSPRALVVQTPTIPVRPYKITFRTTPFGPIHRTNHKKRSFTLIGPIWRVKVEKGVRVVWSIIVMC